MNDKKFYIRERFPDKKQAIDFLLAEDPEFRIICEDYEDCINAFHYWKECKVPEAEVRISEYNTLIQKLEEEVIEALDALNQRKPDL